MYKYNHSYKVTIDKEHVQGFFFLIVCFAVSKSGPLTTVHYVSHNINTFKSWISLWCWTKILPCEMSFKGLKTEDSQWSVNRACYLVDCTMQFAIVGHHPMFLPSVYLTTSHVIKSPTLFPSIFACCKNELLKW